MADTIRVRPRSGLILAGVPREGADIPAALAEEWIGNRMVERVIEPAVTPAPASRTGSSTPPKAVRKAGSKRRSSR